jgi:putative DNA primase/helicase
MTDKIQSESEAAHLFRLEYGELIRFIPERGEWIVRDGNLWDLDGSKGVEALIREFLDRQTGADSRWRGSISVVRSVKAFLETVASLYVSATDLDAREDLLGTATGVYSLKRLKYVSPGAGTYVTKRT